MDNLDRESNQCQAQLAQSRPRGCARVDFGSRITPGHWARPHISIRRYDSGCSHDGNRQVHARNIRGDGAESLEGTVVPTPI
jgi:hypothetical protein